jgi:hypothetical protein
MGYLPLIQTEHACHDAVELRRDHDRSLASSVLALIRVMVDSELYLKGGFYRGGGSANL